MTSEQNITAILQDEMNLQAKTIAIRHDNFFAVVASNGENFFFQENSMSRMHNVMNVPSAKNFTFAQGELISEVDSTTLALLGKYVGLLGKRMQQLGEDAAAAKSDFDLCHYRRFHCKQRHGKIFELACSFIEPYTKAFRKSVVHNNFDPSRVVMSKGKMFAIDLGDQIWSWTVADPAILLGYALHEMKPSMNPIAICEDVLRGYELEHELLPEERRCVFPLAVIWLCMLRTDLEHILPTITCALEDVALIKSREGAMGDKLRLFYESSPMHLVKGKGVYLYDSMGREYMDCYNNVVTVGHCHDHVVNALSEQARTLNTNTRYVTDQSVQYAKRLLKGLPPQYDRVMFVNSGSEANDLAVRISTVLTGHSGALALESAYHGVTYGLVGFTPACARKGKQPSHVKLVPPPDTFRGPYKRDDPKAGEKYADLVDGKIKELQEEGHGLACCMIDPCFMSNGVFEAPDNYLKLVCEKVQKAGGFYIADEVQSGFGRTGSYMWAFQRYNANPDFITIGKPAGNGQPIGAVIMRHELLDKFFEYYSFFSTFGGNNVSSAAGCAVLDIIENEGLVEKCAVVGAYFKEGLKSLQKKYPEFIADVRGSGLALGMEIVKPNSENAPGTEECAILIRLAKEEGIMIGKDGPFSNCVKMRPPLIITPKQIDIALAGLDRAFKKLHEFEFQVKKAKL